MAAPQVTPLPATPLPATPPENPESTRRLLPRGAWNVLTEPTEPAINPYHHLNKDKSQSRLDRHMVKR